MAESKKKSAQTEPIKRKYIDPVYKKYANSIMKTLNSDEFYNFFMENLDHGKKEYQFSNRKLEKKVDHVWVDAVERCMSPFENIIMNPRNFIIEQEEIVNVAVARQSTPDVIRHLTTHGAFVDEVQEDNVRPNHLLNKFKEDTWNTYENRFVFTLLEITNDFVSRRFEAIFANQGEEFGAFLKVDTEMSNRQDVVKCKFDIRVRQNEDFLADDKASMDIFRRIRMINDKLKVFMQSQFARTMARYARVKNPIVKTNAIQKNPNFKGCYELWVFIHNYRDVGYEINIYEQSAEISPSFERDIYENIFFEYLILKNHLEKPSDREIDLTKKFKRRVLRPRVIKKIIEEIVGNYDITATEVRKVLIEEFTKAQLLQQEEKERRRLVEEREKLMAQKRKEEAAEKARQQKKKQMERAKQLRQKEQEKAREQKARKKYKEALKKRVDLYLAEVASFEIDKKEFLENRAKQEEKRIAEAKRAEKARLAAERRKAQQEKKRQQEEKKRQLEEKKRLEEQKQEAAAAAEVTEKNLTTGVSTEQSSEKTAVPGGQNPDIEKPEEHLPEKAERNESPAETALEEAERNETPVETALEEPERNESPAEAASEGAGRNASPAETASEDAGRNASPAETASEDAERNVSPAEAASEEAEGNESPAEANSIDQAAAEEYPAEDSTPGEEPLNNTHTEESMAELMKELEALMAEDLESESTERKSERNKKAGERSSDSTSNRVITNTLRNIIRRIRN